MNRPSQPLRLLLAVALVLAVATLMLTLLSAADAALSVWERLQALPVWMQAAYIALLAALGLGAGWGVWRLLNPRARRATRAEAIDRAALQRRIEHLPTQAPSAQQARRELEEMELRRAQARVQIALFGEISAGKSSLLRALLPEATADIGVIGGTTRAVARHRGTIDSGHVELEVADVPGLQEAGDTERAALARAEAARSHAILYVIEGDLSRSQHDELQALAGFGRPILLLLNKADRYAADERSALLEKLRGVHRGPGMHVLAVSAGHRESLTREHPDGRRERVEREAPAQLGDLPRVLADLARAGADRLEPGREAAWLTHVDAQLATAERAERETRSQAAVRKYTRRAVVGALAAVAPGTDLVIQGALATALLRELCSIHELRIRDVDLDGLLDRAGNLVRTTTSITLAIAGNALKAFPGLGTLGGGLMHAVAYGLIFDSLGRAVAQTLADARGLDREATLQRFRDELEAPAADRLRALAGLALDAWRERDAGTTAAPDRADVSGREVRLP